MNIYKVLISRIILEYKRTILFGIPAFIGQFIILQILIVYFLKKKIGVGIVNNIMAANMSYYSVAVFMIINQIIQVGIVRRDSLNKSVCNLMAIPIPIHKIWYSYSLMSFFCGIAGAFLLNIGLIGISNLLFGKMALPQYIDLINFIIVLAVAFCLSLLNIYGELFTKFGIISSFLTNILIFGLIAYTSLNLKTFAFTNHMKSLAVIIILVLFMIIVILSKTINNEKVFLTLYEGKR